MEGTSAGLPPEFRACHCCGAGQLLGQGALPFKFEPHTFASGEGIDIIASYQLHEADALDSYAPVEVEYNLRNFITHRHPHEHVHLVVCCMEGSPPLPDLELPPASGCSILAPGDCRW